MHATYPAHLILLDLIIQITVGGGPKIHDRPDSIIMKL
jgi:hypothetical protein